MLLAAEKERKQAVQLSKTWPSMTIEDAYAISTEVVERKIDAGAKLIGHKVGLTSKAMQRSSQIDEPDYGHLLDSMMIADGARIAHENYCVPRVEIELAFILGKPLRGPGVRLPDVLRATEYVVPAIEIVDARLQDPRKIFDTVADNGAAAGIVIGGRPVGPLDVDLRWVGGIMYRNAEIEERALPQRCSAILRSASPGSPTSSARWVWGSSPAISSSPVRSPAWCSPRKATRCTPISASSAALPCSLFDSFLWPPADSRQPPARWRPHSVRSGCLEHRARPRDHVAGREARARGRSCIWGTAGAGFWPLRRCACRRRCCMRRYPRSRRFPAARRSPASC
jgi:2-oxo-hept-3-ene-1,7-dioate hydratase